MDRVIPTGQTLAPMQAGAPPICCLVGMPKGRLSEDKQDFSAEPWTQVPAAVAVKLFQQPTDRQAGSRRAIAN